MWVSLHVWSVGSLSSLLLRLRVGGGHLWWYLIFFWVQLLCIIVLIRALLMTVLCCSSILPGFHGFYTCLIIIDHYCYCEVCSSCWLETWSLMFPGSQLRPGAADSPVCVFLSQKLTNISALIRESHFHSCCVATESRRSRPLSKEFHSGKWQKNRKAHSEQITPSSEWTEPNDFL